MTRVFLFDVDGTLLRGDGAGRRAMERALAEVVGREGASASPFEGVRFDGATDRALVRTALGALGAEPPDVERLIDVVLARYLRALTDELARGAALRALEGAAELAAALAELGVVGLGTGNVEIAAHMKIGAVGMGHLFAFGGYGSDAERRADLLAIGAARGAALAGRTLDLCDVVVIGDTPRDIEAGQAIGATVVAVATGSFSGDELTAAGADLVVPSLARPEPIIERVVRGGRSGRARP
ncbi:MAG: haloacid dehalogenase-like hydrolase [Deltaproteobacteria bacterium]|nr:haloacid dehalogenase-like hydrolase [Deltaproteobacteria bacterium]